MPKKTSLMSSALILVTSCGPIQGYPGPELPGEQVATVYRDSQVNSPEQTERFTADSQPFETNGITLLPGVHEIDAFFETYGERRDCLPEYRVDEWGYRACLDNEYRSRRNRRGRLWIRCSIADYTSVVYHCMVKITESDCHFKADLLAGEKYDIVIARPPFQKTSEKSISESNSESNSGPSGIFSRRSKKKVGSSECNEVRTHEARRTFATQR